MRTVETVVEGDELVALKAALDDRSGTERVLWTRRVDLGEGVAVELQVRGGGKEDAPWVDVIMVEKGGQELEDPYSLEIDHGELSEIGLAEIDVVLCVYEGAAPSPAP